MNVCMTKLFGAVLFALVVMVSTADAQLVFATNGDFEAGGADWAFDGGGAIIDFAATGGNGGGGYADMDSSGGWGVLVSNSGNPSPLTQYGLTAGESYDFSIDMIGTNGGEVAGIKIESWLNGAVVSDSGDRKFATTTSWDTYQTNYTITSNADSIKFVPLSVDGGRVGFDNVGVNVPTSSVPEPSSLCVIALGTLGVVSRRRRS